MGLGVPCFVFSYFAPLRGLEGWMDDGRQERTPSEVVVFCGSEVEVVLDDLAWVNTRWSSDPPKGLEL